MALAAGTRLGPYEIQVPLGAGGMGEVYKARDTRLDRVVAIKVLPEHVAGDPESRQRFEREARTISSLNHPHICTLFDVGRQDGVEFLVIEYLEGETLAHRLEKGPLPLDQALKLGVEIADALDKAHRQGITHRDLKPANVMLTRGGAKLLDFGLAKLAGVPSGAVDVTVPATTSPLTGRGTILGTVQYMAPEQLNAEDADTRTDIFAFGALLYEMVTGRKAFEGKSQASVIAAILERDPPPISSVQPLSPAGLDRIVSKCLAKDREARWQSARDLGDELAWIRQGGSQPSVTAVGAAPAWHARIPLGWIATAVLATATLTAGGVWWWLGSRSSAPTPPRMLRFLVETPPVSLVSPRSSDVRLLTQGIGLPALALSPDGKQMVFVALHEGMGHLYLRALDETTAVVLPGTEAAEGPFFSSDGERVGFVANGALKIVSIRGGTPVTIARAPSFRGASWAPDDFVYFAPATDGGLKRVRSTGGEVEDVTTLDLANGVRSHRWPQLLPAGDAMIVTVSRASDTTFADARVAVLTLPSRELRDLVPNATYGRYVPTGHLMYEQGGTLHAAPFDLDRLELAGSAKIALTDVVSDPMTGAVQVAFSEDGMLAYVAGRPLPYDRRLVWVDRTGREEPLPLETRPFQDVRISPNGERIAVNIDGANSAIWIYEVDRATLSRLTSTWTNIYPTWTPDGGSVVFASGRTGVQNIYRQVIGGGGNAELFGSAASSNQRPGSIAADGTLVFTNQQQGTGGDLWIMAPGGQPAALVTEPFDQDFPALSPDSRWLAYVSNESGRDEVYVRPRDVVGGKLQISNGGGNLPLWAGNGRELYFRAGSSMMAVSVTTQPALRVGRPAQLFDGPYVQRYDVSPDGRFVMIKLLDHPLPKAITFVTNWFDELRRAVSTQ